MTLAFIEGLLSPSHLLILGCPVLTIIGIVVAVVLATNRKSAAAPTNQINVQPPLPLRSTPTPTSTAAARSWNSNAWRSRTRSGGGNCKGHSDQVAFPRSKRPMSCASPCGL